MWKTLKLHSPMRGKGVLLILGISLVVGGFLAVHLVQAKGGKGQWTTGRFTSGQQLEFKRDFACFASGRGGPRSQLLSVGPFGGRVVNAEIFISGFSFWHTGGDDSHLNNLAVDATVEQLRAKGVIEPRVSDPKYLIAKILIDLRDKNPTDDANEDNYQACVGYTVIALTQP